jgi:hypothetical protein
MRILKYFLPVLLCLSLNTAAFSACQASGASSNLNQLAEQEEFGPLQIAIADLQEVVNLINEGNKKTAIVILKSARGQLRKINELTPRMVKGMTARLNKAISAVKKGDNATALSEVNHVLSELQTL